MPPTSPCRFPLAKSQQHEFSALKISNLKTSQGQENNTKQTLSNLKNIHKLVLRLEVDHEKQLNKIFLNPKPLVKKILRGVRQASRGKAFQRQKPTTAKQLCLQV